MERDDTGAYPIDQNYASECGYTYTYEVSGRAALRASYLSCHTTKRNDEAFVLRFNLITVDDSGSETPSAVSQTCSLPLPWSPREVICEQNYIEVTVRRDVPCTPSGGTSKEVWNAALSVAYTSASPAWQVIFLKEDELVTPMPISEARLLGYVMSATAERIVFRAGYGQPHSTIKMMNGIPVEVLHATVFFRQKWMVVMMDIVAACTLNAGSFDGFNLIWETPTVMAPLIYNHSAFISEQIRMGVEAQFLDESTIRERGYTLDYGETTVQISVPYAARGGYRRSMVLHNTYHESYFINLYYEHVFVDGSGIATRLRQVWNLISPLQYQHPFTIDQTVLEERVFTVYLGVFPFDVALVALTLNGEPFTVAEAIQSGYPITEVPHANGTHAYVLRVPFEDPIIPKMYFTEGILQYSLDINYTLNIMPQEDPYYHSASVVAKIKDVFPPDFNGVCTETGIIFKMDHQKMGHLWEIGIGHHPLTPELAVQRGYILQNDSRSLTLEVPVFTIGYIYEDITLQQFFGTFELLSRDAKTLEIQKSTAKRCLFKTDELIVCSTDGIMTVVASMAWALPAADPNRATLLDPSCKLKDTDGTRVLFAFGVNTCGTRVMVDDSYVIYENEIQVNIGFTPESTPVITRDADFRLTIQCYYQAYDINRLFVDRKFKSETPGFGSIIQASSSPVKHIPQRVAPTPGRVALPRVAPTPGRVAPQRVVPTPSHVTPQSVPPATSSVVKKPMVPPTLEPVKYVFESCQLNTPRPIMSVRPAMPPEPDPFRTRPCPTRDLGSELWTWDHLYDPLARRPENIQRQTVEIIQVSPEEDQAITNLLKLHYHASGDALGRGTAADHGPLSQPGQIPAQPSEPVQNLAGGVLPLASVLESESTERPEVELETANILLTLEDMGTTPEEVEPLSPTHTEVELPSPAHTEVEPPSLAHAEAEPPSPVHTEAEPPSPAHTVMEPASPAHTEAEPPNPAHTEVEPLSPAHTKVAPLSPAQGDPGAQNAENQGHHLPAGQGVLPSYGGKLNGMCQKDTGHRPQDGLDSKWSHGSSPTPCMGQSVSLRQWDTGQGGFRGAWPLSKESCSDLEETAAYALLELSEQREEAPHSQGM
ncbi:uncharacterized protein LOC118791167 [Megalops cyprinoides]|uniref:uncharacterized protein LOC118791167 n=1 Tax=Megalops cyprinoides TaxID=118141 RepID=UPI00186530DC|nr:uncharacterized protein LOC118791167 [Megalops cyprinoides]